MRVRFSPVPWGHRPAGGRQTGSLETRVRFPVTPPLFLWAARGAQAGFQNQLCGVRVPGCLQRRANMAGPWPGRKPVRAFGLSVQFRRSPQWKTNAAGPRTALKAVGTAGSGDHALRLPLAEGERGRAARCLESRWSPRAWRSIRPPSALIVSRRVARTGRGRLAKPKPVVVSPEQVRLLHSPLCRPRGREARCRSAKPGTRVRFPPRSCAQGVSGCTPDRQSEGAGSIPAGRSGTVVRAVRT